MWVIYNDAEGHKRYVHSNDVAVTEKDEFTLIEVVGKCLHTRISAYDCYRLLHKDGVLNLLDEANVAITASQKWTAECRRIIDRFPDDALNQLLYTYPSLFDSICAGNVTEFQYNSLYEMLDDFRENEQYCSSPTFKWKLIVEFADWTKKNSLPMQLHGFHVIRKAVDTDSWHMLMDVSEDVLNKIMSK